MDLGVIRGLMTALMLIAFSGVVVWAYSRRRQSDFEAASRLPLDDNDGSDS